MTVNPEVVEVYTS